jgi:hypothetical protein
MAIQEGIQHGPYISQRQTEQKKKANHNNFNALTWSNLFRAPRRLAQRLGSHLTQLHPTSSHNTQQHALHRPPAASRLTPPCR